MKTLVLSLERSGDRRRHMEAELGRLGIAFEFFLAVDGTKGEHLGFPQYDLRRSQRFFGVTMGPGEFACFASHQLMWQRCIDEGRPILVCEDDIAVDPRFPTAIRHCEAMLDHVPLVRLGGLDQRPYRTVRDLADGFRLVRFLRGPSGAQCYGISPAGARALLDALTWWLEPLDRWLDSFWRHGVDCHAILPFTLHHLRRLPTNIDKKERVRTIYRLPRKVARVGDHVRRLLYNARQRDIPPG